jgi:hypothetical protein
MDQGVQLTKLGRATYPTETIRYVQSQYDRLRSQPKLITQFL